MADDQAPDLWHFERQHRFETERLSISDGGVREQDGSRLLVVWAEDGDHMVKIALPWAAVRELADEALQDWLYDPSVPGAHDAGHGDGDGGREGEPVGPVDPAH